MNEKLTTATHKLQTQAARLIQAGYNAGWLSLACAVVEGSLAHDCEACQASLPDYIEAELNRTTNVPSTVRRHLDCCPTCTATYLDLLEIALLTEENRLPVEGQR